MRRHLASSIAFLLAACAPDGDTAAKGPAAANGPYLNGLSVANSAPPVAPGVTLEPARSNQTRVPTTPATDLALSMPRNLRGAWRADDLERAPTDEDCNQTSSSNRNFGKVLTIRQDGYSLFEEGGRLITVHALSDDMIEATFDTTYADTPTRARLAFKILPGGRLSVTDKDASGRTAATAYRRCPA
ncbi:MAG: hypothetical protein M3Q83_00150 [Pseudomonadota bacterium]|nr:hypothetical protein [Pseudomonadota bacterium]